MPASAGDAWTAAHATQSSGGMETQFPAVSDEEVGDLVLFEVSPQIFDRIEFWRIGRQPLDPEASVALRQQRLDRFAAVNGSAIPDDQQFAWQMPEQRLEEFRGAFPVDAALVDPEVKLPQREARDDRQFVPIEGLAQHRRLSTRRPRAHPMRPRAQSAFVDEDDSAALAPGFFLSRGHPTRFHSAMALSSRSIARRVGCWQLKPSPRSSRQTCPG